MNATAKLCVENFSTLATSAEGIAKLRELILQLAVQGKLVPQDPKDEPASKLLEKIQAEKVDIALDQYPHFLPDSWEWVRLGSISKIGTGKKDVNEGNLKGKYPFFTCASEPLKSDTYFVDGECLILPGNGANVGLVTHFIGKCELYQRTYVVTDIRIYARYVDVYLKAHFKRRLEGQHFGSAINYIKIGNLTEFLFALPPLAEQKRIVAKVDQLMALCDTLEQHLQQSHQTHRQLNDSAIHHLLTAENARDFEKTWKLICDNFSLLYNDSEAVEKLRQAILQLAVQGKLVPQDPKDEPSEKLLEKIHAEKAKLIKERKLKKQETLPPIKDDEIPYALPRGWQWIRLGDITETITKGSSPKWQGVQYTSQEDGVLFVTSENVGSFTLKLSSPKYVEKKFNDMEKRSILQKYDLLMNLVGASIGRAAIYDIDEVANINQAVALIRIVNGPIYINLRYLLYFFNSPICISYMFDKQVESARANLSLTSVSYFVTPIPPLAEQKRIVAKVDKLMALCDQLQGQIESARTQAQQLTASTIHHLLAG